MADAKNFCLFRTSPSAGVWHHKREVITLQDCISVAGAESLPLLSIQFVLIIWGFSEEILDKVELAIAVNSQPVSGATLSKVSNNISN